jgi:pyrimidine operon attenuation protein/uracil phosphoribosyltransferase
MSEKQIILNHEDIQLLIKRLSLEIAENHVNEKPLCLVGLNERGYFIAKEIFSNLKDILPNQTIVTNQMTVSRSELKLTNVIDNIQDVTVVIIDDVVNSGYTAMKTVAYFFENGCNQIETAFLAQREHLNFPILANYVGLSIATTLKDHVYFDNSNSQQIQIYLA